MPRDATFGLVVGVGLVIVVAVFFHRQEVSVADPAAATIIKPVPLPAPHPVPRIGRRPIEAKPTARPVNPEEDERTSSE
jgi:hypothetical protein